MEFTVSNSQINNVPLNLVSGQLLGGPSLAEPQHRLWQPGSESSLALNVETRLAQIRPSLRGALVSAVAWRGVRDHCCPGTNKGGPHPAGRRPSWSPGSQLILFFPSFPTPAGREPNYSPNSNKPISPHPKLMHLKSPLTAAVSNPISLS